MVERRPVLHALGDDLEAEVVAEVDRRADDDQVTLVAQHRRDERAVDLQLVDRHLAQVGERRVAGAEVVDRQVHPELAEAADGRQRAVGIGHEHALGDLELQGIGRQRVGGQQPLDPLGKIAVEQIAHRQVDRDREIAAVAAPAGALGDRALEHVAGERADQPGLLDRGHERPRSDQPMVGMLPAHEALGAAHRALADVDDRLEVDDDLVGGERVADVGQHAQPPHRVLILLGAVDLEIGLRVLGGVHRDVGAPQQSVRVLAVGGEARHADAGPDLQRELVERERRADAPQQPGQRRVEHGRIVGLLGQQDPELVTAEPRDEAALADRLDQPRAEVAQQQVTVVVTERVVDLLEAIEVHQQHAEARLGRSRHGDPLLHRVAEALAVGQAGELVGRRHPLQQLAAALGGQQLADEVLEDDHHQSEQHQPGRPEVDGDVDRDERQQRREQLGRQDRDQHLARLLDHRPSPRQPLVGRHAREVEHQRDDERGEHEQVVGGGPRADVRDRGDLGEQPAGDEREPRERQQVVTEVLSRLARVQPTDRDRRDAEQRRRTATEQHCGEHDAEKAAGDPERDRCRSHRGQVADDRERGDHRQRQQAPVVKARRERRRGRSGRDQQALNGGTEASEPGGRLLCRVPFHDKADRPRYLKIESKRVGALYVDPAQTSRFSGYTENHAHGRR